MKKNNRFWILPLTLISFFSFLTNSCKKYDEFNNNPGTVTDQDGNVYRTVSIGTQVWMVENLNTTKYRNGEPIANITDDTVWFDLTSGAFCNYNNDTANSTTYGRLYNWYAVNDSRNIAPVGWHVPSEEDWTTLTTYLVGGESEAGGKLKEAGIAHWLSPNTDATNKTGFTALPGGYRNFTGTFLGIGYGDYYWSSVEDDDSDALCRALYCNSSQVDKASFYKTVGISVRCIKD
jgi:uncharacterized protein (TIGR02145 family)